jgi:predicted ArsR family transcriptional regulator
MAKRLGITERQVQRHLLALKDAGLIERHFPNRPGRHPYQYTFNGLVNKLKKIAVVHRHEKRQKEFSRDRAVRSASKEWDSE